MKTRFPVIDPVATGANIIRLRSERGLTVRDLQEYFGFDEPRAIYKWQRGQTLPSVDNLFALGAILNVPLDEILVPAEPHLNMVSTTERQASACRSALFFVPFCTKNCMFLFARRI
ncbi:MAG: helix-turn-helix transcriptional regulator [Ruminococcaceae bacterium]|nr:helix-turn-helix transcriptional regulator [Oscillospiraceae bacterium]